MSSTEPLVSLVLCVRDGMPYLPEAVESARAQTYENLEVVVQDGASTDGSLDYLQSLPGVALVSEPDRGVGDAFDRAFRRCQGEIVGTIDADNVLAPEAVATAVEAFRSRPDYAAFYGSVELVDEGGAVVSTFVPGEFDLLRVIACELVPPFSTSFFSRRNCGSELRFEERMATCADYDLWLRLSHLLIGRIDRVLGRTRLSEKSMTRNADCYERFCEEKLDALERYLAPYGRNPLVEAVQRSGFAGINLWCAESVWSIEGTSEGFHAHLAAAASVDPGSPRLRRLLGAVHGAEAQAVVNTIVPETELDAASTPDRRHP